MPIGTIQRWNTDRAFGSISDDSDPRKKWSFVHITQLPRGNAPELGDSFSYELATGRDGRESAVNLIAMTEERAEVDRIFGVG